MTWLLYIAFAVLVAFKLRHLWAPLQRLNDVHWQALVLVDIAAGFAIFAPLYVAGVYPACPDPRETISSIVGRHVLLGKRWAIKLARVIDGAFFLLTSQRDHCVKAALKHGGN